MSESSIVVEYECKCGNRVPAGESGKQQTYKVGKSVTVHNNCRVICLDCGKNMKLVVTREGYKREVTIISEEE